ARATGLAGLLLVLSGEGAAAGAEHARCRGSAMGRGHDGSPGPADPRCARRRRCGHRPPGRRPSARASRVPAGKGYKRLQSDIRDLVQKLEPETSRERAERAARSRHVTMTPLADGMARVSAVLRGIDAVALMHSLRTRAESLRASGAKDSPTALEADLLVD